MADDEAKTGKSNRDWINVEEERAARMGGEVQCHARAPEAGRQDVWSEGQGYLRTAGKDALPT
jgi:hypothetical protein